MTKDFLDMDAELGGEGDADDDLEKMPIKKKSSSKKQKSSKQRI